MKSKLIVKNFGAITNATLDLRSVNVLIGPQGSGKSTLAKLYTICNSPELYHIPINKKYFFFSITQKKQDLEVFKEVSIERFKEALDNYSILNCFKRNTEIEYQCPTHKIKIKDNKIYFEDNLDTNKLIDLYEKEDYNSLKKEFKNLSEISMRFKFLYVFDVYWNRLSIDDKRKPIEGDEFQKFYEKFNFNNIDLSKKEILKVIESIRNFKSEIFHNNPLYIPAERNIVSHIKQAFLSFQSLNLPIPKHLIDFAATYNNATYKIKTLDISFLKDKTLYKNVNGEDRIYFSPRKSIKLSESASGFQSIIPIILPILYQKNKDTYPKLSYSFVIEEPETNLFPRAQYDLLQLLEKDRSDDFGMIDRGIMHIYTTHSPFILSSLNNLLFAYIKGKNKDIEKEIDKVISKDCWINPNEFSAYQIVDGKTKSILNRKSGLIENNVIDSVSEDIMNDFREIAYLSADK